MIIGMDFGTTNSGMAWYDGRSVQILPLDPASPNPRVLRTALYIPNDQNIAIGRAAVDRYFEQNVGRPVKMQYVWVGEIEVHGADMHFVTDVYVWIDAFSPGRLFLSFKSGLRERDYAGTVIGQFFYPIEDIVAIYLSAARERASRLLGRELRQVVLGRPVRFSTDPQHDRLAQHRLLDAAFRAGYETVYLQYEPIAAAYSYAASVDQPQNILVFDFGGGTLDLTVMHIDGRRRQVLATGGLPIAGDVFDQRLVRAKLPPHFGEGTTYGPGDKELPVPRWLFDIFSDWQRILELQTPENKRILQEIAQTARHPHQIQALISLVSGNYGLKMFDVIEQAKRELSERIGTMIRLQGPSFNVLELVTRSQFEAVIRPEIVAIDQHVDEIVAASGLQPAQIDAVVRTGGSAQIPVFKELLQEKFGRERLLAIDTFSSVTAGLGITGHGVDVGEIELRAYTPADLERAAASEAQVPRVNLGLIRRRIAFQERVTGETTASPELLLVVLTAAGRLATAVLPPETIDHPEAHDLTAATRQELSGGARAAILARLDAPLLLVTSQYRFLLTSGRQLAELPDLGLSLSRLFALGSDEQLCALSRWPAITAAERLVVATSRGYARSYQADALIPLIEGPAPHRFDQPLAGLPVAVLGAAETDELALVTGQGRANRTPLSIFPIAGRQAISCSGQDWVIAATTAEPTDELLVATASGHGRRLPVTAVDQPERPNQKGRTLIARRPVVDLQPLLRPLAGEGPVWLLTNRRLAPVTPPPPDPDSTRSHPLLRLAKDETALALVRARGERGGR